MNRRTELIIFTILIMLLGSTLRELLRAPKELDRINNTVVDWFGSEQRKSSSSSGVASGQHHHVTLSSTISDYMIKRYAPKLQQSLQAEPQQQQQEEEYQNLSKNITVSLK